MRLEGRDRGIGKQHRRGGQEPRRRELRDRGQGNRGRAQREVQVDLVFLGRVLGVGQRGFEDLDNLVSAQLLAVVLDQDRARERVGLEIVDSQHAHQFALDGLTELGLAVDDRILEPQAPGQLVLDFPVRDDRAVPEVADLALGVTDRCDRGDGHRRIFDPAVG